MTTSTADTRRAEALRKAMSSLREAAEILREFEDDPRVELVLPQLEGMSEGWSHPPTDAGAKPQDYLIDLLIDLLAEAEGSPIEDHWRGHPMTVDEAEIELGRLARIMELR